MPACFPPTLSVFTDTRSCCCNSQAERSICQLEEAGETAAAAALRRKLERPPLAEMVEDFGVLVAELERCFGSDRVLPSRNQLREMNRCAVCFSRTRRAARAAQGAALQLLRAILA